MQTRLTSKKSHESLWLEWLHVRIVSLWLPMLHPYDSFLSKVGFITSSIKGGYILGQGHNSPSKSIRPNHFSQCRVGRSLFDLHLTRWRNGLSLRLDIEWQVTAQGIVGSIPAVDNVITWVAFSLWLINIAYFRCWNTLYIRGSQAFLRF